MYKEIAIFARSKFDQKVACARKKNVKNDLSIATARLKPFQFVKVERFLERLAFKAKSRQK